MIEDDLKQALTSSTGESVKTIARRGFQIADSDEVRFAPGLELRRPLTIDRDGHFTGMLNQRSPGQRSIPDIRNIRPHERIREVLRPGSSPARHKHAVLTSAIVVLIMASLLGLLAYDAQTGLAGLGILSIAITVGFFVHRILHRRRADVVVTLGVTEVKITLHTVRKADDETNALLFSLGEEVLHQLQRHAKPQPSKPAQRPPR